MERAYQIIKSESLRFSKFNRLNDINERWRMVYCNPDSNLNLIINELANYRQLSLCIDGNRPGYAIPAMWGHYGDCGQGACLLFNKKVLLDKLSDDAHHDNVIYSGEYYQDAHFSIIYDRTTNIKEFFNRKIKDIFFKKTGDWSYEQEYRIVCRAENKDENCYLPIKDALLAIIIFMPNDISEKQSAFNSDKVKTIKQLIPDTPILEMGKFLEDFSLRDSDGNTFVTKNHKLVKAAEQDVPNIDT